MNSSLPTVTHICFRLQNEVLLPHCKKEKKGTVKAGSKSSYLFGERKNFYYLIAVFILFTFFFIFKPVSQNSGDKKRPPYAVSPLSLSHLLESTQRSHAGGLMFISMRNVGSVYQVCLPKELLLLSTVNFDKNWHCN